MQKHVNLVDLVKSFPTNIYLQNLASIQKRTSPVKSAHLAEKPANGSISNLSTKVDGVTAGEACCACGGGKITANNHEYTPEEVEKMKALAAEMGVVHVNPASTAFGAAVNQHCVDAIGFVDSSGRTCADQS